MVQHASSQRRQAATAALAKSPSACPRSFCIDLAFVMVAEIFISLPSSPISTELAHAEVVAEIASSVEASGGANYRSLRQELWPEVHAVP
jgi:hypothetical protein